MNLPIGHAMRSCLYKPAPRFVGCNLNTGLYMKFYKSCRIPPDATLWHLREQMKTIQAARLSLFMPGHCFVPFGRLSFQSLSVLKLVITSGNPQRFAGGISLPPTLIVFSHPFLKGPIPSPLFWLLSLLLGLLTSQNSNRSPIYRDQFPLSIAYSRLENSWRIERDPRKSKGHDLIRI